MSRVPVTGAYILSIALGAAMLATGCGGGGGSSAPAPSPPQPVLSLTSLSPIVAMQGTAGITLKVNGTGFTSSSQLLFDRVAKPTTFVSSYELTVQLTSSDISRPGTFPVTVQSGGQTTRSQKFYVVPTINSQPVAVVGGTESGNVNVAVPPLANPSLSVIAVGVGNTAKSVGISVPRGDQPNVFLVGKGIVPGSFYMVSGDPADVTVTQPDASAFTHTMDGLPAVYFNLKVSSTAALGPRNILITNPAGEITVFVGGLLITE
jgi:3-hydroxymyristoyl/3-hydroxydecanoyl-(acyl carrier protein) dehydratase